MAYKITNKIPPPFTIDNTGIRSKYPFGKMKVGDSFKMNIPEGSSISIMQISVIDCSKRWAKRNKKKWIFTSRKAENKKSLRVWRIL